MDIYHIWFNLKDSHRDLEFCDVLKTYMEFLRKRNMIEGHRLTRRKLGFGPDEIGEYHLMIDVRDLAQLDEAFQLAATRAAPVEGPHAAVYSRVKDVRFALYRDFPDPVRKRPKKNPENVELQKNPADLQETYPMPVGKIEFRRFTRDDFPSMRAWARSPEFLMQWTGRTFHWPLDDTQLESYLAESECKPPRRMLFMAVDAEDGRTLGHIGLRDIDLTDNAAMISCVLVGDEEARGQGVGKAMVEWICDFGFTELGLHRLELYVFDFNTAAIACYERVGFKLEGVLRDKRKLGEEYWSPCIMSLLRPEWETQRLSGDVVR